MCGRAAGSRIGHCIDVDVVVPHVVREAVKDDGLVEDLVERLTQSVFVHVVSLASRRTTCDCIHAKRRSITGTTARPRRQFRRFWRILILQNGFAQWLREPAPGGVASCSAVQ
jgi:hypothetical protein